MVGPGVFKMPTTDAIDLIRMGQVAYRQALRLMQRLADARGRDDIGDVLLVVEHPPVVTLGCGGGGEDLRVSADVLQRLGIEVVQTERGRPGHLSRSGPTGHLPHP